MGEVLQKFGMNMMMNCRLCNNNNESLDHVFLLCPWSWNLWSNCMNWWDISFCAPFSLIDRWRGWVGLCSRKNSERVWVSLFFAVTWMIWEVRNGKVFKNKEASLSKAMDMVKFRVAW